MDALITRADFDQPFEFDSIITVQLNFLKLGIFIPSFIPFNRSESIPSAIYIYNLLLILINERIHIRTLNIVIKYIFRQIHLKKS